MLSFRPGAILGCSLALAMALLVSCRQSGSNQAATVAATPLRPLNLVVVTVDTLRPDHLHCYGYSKIETPAIDSIAKDGVLFENAVTQTPLTTPSHASIFTGLNPTTHHVRDTGGFILQSSSTTLATILQQQGWDTAAFISSAVLKKLFGLNQGFRVYDDQMPKPGKGHEFLEDAERRAGDTVDRAIRWLDTRSQATRFSFGSTCMIRMRPINHPLHSGRNTKAALMMARSPTPTTNWDACSLQFARSRPPRTR